MQEYYDKLVSQPRRLRHESTVSVSKHQLWTLDWSHKVLQHNLMLRCSKSINPDSYKSYLGSTLLSNSRSLLHWLLFSLHFSFIPRRLLQWRSITNSSICRNQVDFLFCDWGAWRVTCSWMPMLLCFLKFQKNLYISSQGVVKHNSCLIPVSC